MVYHVPTQIKTTGTAMSNRHQRKTQQYHEKPVLGNLTQADLDNAERVAREAIELSKQNPIQPPAGMNKHERAIWDVISGPGDPNLGTTIRKHFKEQFREWRSEPS